MTAAGGSERAQRRGGRLMWKSRRVFYGMAVLAVVVLGGAWMVLNTIELPEEDQPIETTFVCDINTADGQCGFDDALASLTASEERVLVAYDDLPAVVVQAVLATEDRNFFDHGGIDPIGISRAVVRDVIGDSQSQQGGSTITQQYVKSVYLTSERTLDRKLREAVLAVKLEQELDKREILTRYLNQVYFGRGAYGVEAASREYFGVPVEQVSLAQAAYLAGLIRSPESADASRDPVEASRRRAATLTAMVEEGYITREEADDASAIPWVSEPVADDGTPQAVTFLPRVEREADFNNVRFAEVGSEYWMEWVRSELRDRFGSGTETQGLRVYTTFDPELQQAAYESVSSVLDEEGAPLGSLVAVDSIGRVRAMVGGRDFNQSQVNLALGAEGGGSGRPAGSTFKPFALAAFVEDGYSIESRFSAPATTSFPEVYSEPGELWEPANYENASYGVQTVEEATWKSINTVYAGMVDEIGPPELVDMAGRLGVTSELSADYSLVLGTGEVSVLDMATAYSTFANRGVHNDPFVIRRIEDSSGNVLYDVADEQRSERVIDEGVADTVTNALLGVVTKGTGTAAGLQVPAAGKTGTTDEYSDAWFAGYTCDMTAAVWMGYENPAPMEYQGKKVSGGSYPAQIWHDFMEVATEGDDSCDYFDADAGDEILNSSQTPASETTTTTSPPSTTAPESTTTEPADTTTTSASTTTAAPTTTTTAAPATTTAAPSTTAAPASP